MRASTRGVSAAALAKQEAACFWLVECLYQAYCCFPRAEVALPRSVADYSQNRIDPIPHGYDIVNRVLLAGESLGWIDRVTGHRGGPEGNGRVTRLAAQGALLLHFDDIGVQWQYLQAPAPDELIIIAMGERGARRRLLTRAEDARVGPMQDNLYRINDFLLSQCIHLNCSNDDLLHPTDGVRGLLKRDRDGSLPALNFQNVAMR